jgi:hypothetical protein
LSIIDRKKKLIASDQWSSKKIGRQRFCRSMIAKKIDRQRPLIVKKIDRLRFCRQMIASDQIVVDKLIEMVEKNFKLRNCGEKSYKKPFNDIKAGFSPPHTMKLAASQNLFCQNLNIYTFLPKMRLLINFLNL